MTRIKQLQMTETSQHERELTITIESSMVGQEFLEAVNKVQRVASRPGFRPGKMPRPMVMNFFGAEIKQKLIKTLMEKSFDDACKEKELIPVSKPMLEPMGEIFQDQPFTYRAIFQIKPKVVLATYQKLPIERKKFVFSETDVDDELRSLQENMATFVEPSDRKEIGLIDLVQCDSIVKIDGIENPNYSHKDYGVPLFANVPADLKNALVGKKVGDSATVKYTMPADHQDESISGKECEMFLTVTSFKERVLPVLNDDFAKDLSDKFTTLEEVKESIRLRFSTTVKRRDEYFRQEAITKALVNANPVDVPPALVERMALSLINRELEAMGQKAAEDLMKNHWQEMWQSVQERALFRVKIELLLEVLIAELNITAEEGEIVKKMSLSKDMSREDAAYSVQVEKVMLAVEKEALTTFVEEPLFSKG
jgi:trigger factor